MSMLLRVDNIVKHYVQGGGYFAPKRILRAVDGVSFALAAKRTLGIVGESGCGKSTTARLALGLIPATAGRIIFDGRELPPRRDETWRSLRRSMQMVYQDPLAALDRRLTVGEQVMEPMTIHGLEDGAKARREKALELFNAVGLRPDLFMSYPHELSGGQRQRVVLARALILGPKLLICDEPISALDVSVAAQVINLLQDLQARLGMAYLFISHDLKMVRQVADDIAVMYLGRIVEQGPADDIFRSPVHPYTEALLSAIPSLGRGSRRRIVLKGDPPSPMDVPSGCPFHPRCPRVVARCRSEPPALRQTYDGRLVACHLAPEALVSRQSAA